MINTMSPQGIPVYGVSDAYKHISPLHYHLLKNDIPAAIHAIRRGADLLIKDEHDISALELLFRLIFEALNRCLASSVPLGTHFRSIGLFSISDCNRKEVPKNDESTEETPILGGLSDYGIAVNYETKGGDGDGDENSSLQTITVLSQYVALFFDGVYTNEERIIANFNKLLRRTRGLLAVIKCASENAELALISREILRDLITQLCDPLLYHAVMDYLFSKTSLGLKELRLDPGNILDARRVYQLAIRSKSKGNHLLKFMAQILKLVEDLFSGFHVNIYSTYFNKKGDTLKHGVYGQLILELMEPKVVETFAHMAFVMDLPLMFDILVLQPGFMGEKTYYNWNQLLLTIIEEEKFRVFVEPLMRKSLRNRVDRVLYPD